MTYKILLIEQSHLNQKVLSVIIKQQGYETLIASNRQEAVALAEAHRPELIVCDSKTLDLPGVKICQEFKSHEDLKESHFIILVHGRLQDRILALESGADDVLIKPLEPVELQAKIKSGLRFYQAKQDLKDCSEDLRRQKEFIDQELVQAASYVQSLLPQNCIAQPKIDSCLLPSSKLGGDFYDYYWLDDENLMFYLLDVSGHGIGAALPSVSIHNVLRSRALPNANFYKPESVLASLNRLFPMTVENQRFFTMWYGVYNSKTSKLTYASAGHPPTILISQCSNAEINSQLIGQIGTFPIGLIEDATYESYEHEIKSMSDLYLFSDGAYEIELTDGRFWRIEDFQNWLIANIENMPARVEKLLENLRQFHNLQSFSDDCSIIKISFT